jgi:hypothetical protein
MRDWLILGGGIHGTHLSLVLSRRLQVAPERLCVLDPHDTPRASRGLFVTGPLAELELGPTARNIAGARRAGERIARAA